MSSRIGPCFAVGNMVHLAEYGLASVAWIVTRARKAALVGACLCYVVIRSLPAGSGRRFRLDMVKIRLMRMGMKGAPSYRVVVADARSPRDGRFIENIGWYNPLTEPSTIQINAERAKHWMQVGAQPTQSVRSLLVRSGVIERGGQASASASATEAAAGTGVEKAAPKAAKPKKTAKK